MKENIEEDIKIVQEFLIEQNKRKQRLIDNPYRQLFYTDEELQAIDHVISNYKRVLKENEELKEKWDKDTHKLQNDLDIANAKIIDWEKAYQEEKDKQFELLRENQKLQKENEELKHKYDKALSDLVKVEKESKTFKSFTSAIFNDEIEKELIPVQKIKDKIEEYLGYDKKYKTYTKDGKENFTMEYFKAKALQDLLEEKGE